MKLARYISVILTFLILFSNIGMALNVHFCHGAVSGVSVAFRTAEKKVVEEPKSCCSAVTEAVEKCCKDQTVKLQDKTDQVIVKSLMLDLAAFYPVPDWKASQTPNYEATIALKDNPSFYCDSHAPPLFKLYCQYIFYA